MIIKKIRKQKNILSLQNFVFNYLPAIGFEQFSAFIESDSKTFTIRFKNHKKMQIILSADPSCKNYFDFSLYLLSFDENCEYITFSFENGHIVPKKYVIKHNFENQGCNLEQIIYFGEKIELLNHICLSAENSDLELLRSEISNFLPKSDNIDCFTKQTLQDPVLESHFGSGVMNKIVSGKTN